MENYDRSKLAVILFGKALARHALSPGDASIKVFSTHPGAVATGQQDMMPTGYGKIGEVIAPVVKSMARSPEHGALCALWAATAPDARKYDDGTYFTDPREEGKEISQAGEDSRIENFWRNSQLIIQKVAGENALVDWQKQ